MTEQEMKKTMGALIDAMAECAWDACDLDGFSCQEILFNLGLFDKRPCTKEEANEMDCDEGDSVYFLSPFAKECRKLSKQP